MQETIKDLNEKIINLQLDQVEKLEAKDQKIAELEEKLKKK
jgi:hypothetical protein